MSTIATIIVNRGPAGPAGAAGPVKTVDGIAPTSGGDVAVSPAGFNTSGRQSVDKTGAVASTAGLQSLLTSAAGSFPSAKKFGRGGVANIEPGSYLSGPLNMSTWATVRTQGAQASAVITMQHGTTADAAQITMADDSDQSASIGAIPVIWGLSLNGDRTTATVAEHGVYMPELVGDKDDAPFFVLGQVANYSGDGLRIGKRHNQLRAIGQKWIANGGWGLNLEKSSDSKMTQVGIGRNLAGQISLKNCASMNVAQFDIWTPGGGIFEGLYALYSESCRNLRFISGEFQGVGRFLGGNYTVGDQTRFQITGNTLGFFNAKVSPETYSGIQYTGGGGSTAYDAIFQMRGENGTKFAHGTIGFSQGPATAEDIAAKPKYVWKFTVPSGGNEDHAGWVEITDVQMLHMQHSVYDDGAGSVTQATEVPFSQHWSNDPARCIWRSPEPGTLVVRPIAAAAINLLRCDGSTITGGRDIFPLLAAGLSYTYNHTQGANRDLVLPNAATWEATLPAGFGVFVVAW